MAAWSLSLCIASVPVCAAAAVLGGMIVVGALLLAVAGISIVLVLGTVLCLTVMMALMAGTAAAFFLSGYVCSSMMLAAVRILSRLAGRVTRRIKKGRASSALTKKQAISTKHLGITVDASPKDSAPAAPSAEAASQPAPPEKQQSPAEEAFDDKTVPEDETPTPMAPKVTTAYVVLLDIEAAKKVLKASCSGGEKEARRVARRDLRSLRAVEAKARAEGGRIWEAYLASEVFVRGT